MLILAKRTPQDIINHQIKAFFGSDLKHGLLHVLHQHQQHQTLIEPYGKRDGQISDSHPTGEGTCCSSGKINL